MQNKIIVSPDPEYPAAVVSFKNKNYKAVIGRSGAVPEIGKFEGDGYTPLGSFEVLGVYYRPDRISRPSCDIPIHEITEDDVWVDEPSSELYNKPCKIHDIDEGVSYEKLYRNDHLYDIFLDLNYNRNPVRSGKGCAIFMHVARNEEKPYLKPTLGCIAMSKNDLIKLISSIGSRTIVSIQ